MELLTAGGFYNPIVRNFNRYRAALGALLGVPRRAVRPGTPLAELVPPSERRRVGAELRSRGLGFDPALTVGEAAVDGTSYRDHVGSGYRWSRGDLMLKVRLLAAAHAGRPLGAVRPVTPWHDLG